MKNMVIGALAGLLIAQSSVWVYADGMDRILIALFSAATIAAVVGWTDDISRKRRMSAWRIRRKIRQLENCAKQNRP